MLRKFKEYLQHTDRKTLPGKKAHQKMMPVPLNKKFIIPDTDSETGRKNGVLIPLYPGKNDEINVILTLRTEDIRHAGQISFPGGRCHQNETPEQAALRECSEEIGVQPQKVEVAGNLSSFYLYRSDSRIFPYIGFLESKPEMKPNPAEVEEIITVSLHRLWSGDDLKREEKHFEHNSFDVPYWDIHRVPLWGATAMIMSELLEIYGRFLMQGKGKSEK